MHWDDYEKHLDFADLKGKTLVSAAQRGDEVHFTDSEGNEYALTHIQDCCESVTIESITGDLNDLIGSEILLAEESSENGERGEWGDSSTWTFYKIATNKGYVDIRFYGSSNGYYSESADFVLLKTNKEV